MERTNNAIFSLGSATHAAKRAADIVFILQNKERLEDASVADRLNVILGEYGEPEADITAADLESLKTVSRKLYTVFASQEVKNTANLLNAILREYAHAPRLSAHAGTPWHLHVDNEDHAPWAEWFAASSAFALAILFAEKQRNPSGLCASSACSRPFIDLGKGGKRKYCSSKCATRERVAVYRKIRQAQ
jgi:predicted RNA-binding Zn ribbon-like protein